MATSNRITQLATAIGEDTKIVDDYFIAHGLQTPTLDHTAPGRLPIPEEAAHIERARQRVIQATTELQQLMRGPAELIRPAYTANVALQAIVRFGFAQAFPVGSQTTFARLAQQSGVAERNVRRLIRHAMTEGLFHEPEKGIVAHTGMTRLLAEDEQVRWSVQNTLDELWPPATRAIDALEKWPGSEEPNETGFTLANNTTMSMWEVYDNDSARSEKFGRGMSSMDGVRGYEPELLIHGFPWAELGAGTVVDVGGSHGTVMINLARAFPRLHFIVQDLPKVTAAGHAMLPDDVQDQVEFMSHDFFTDQPVVADVYYMRSILHNWSDKYSIRILQRLRPALHSGARILVHELVLPEPNTLPMADEKRIRHMDISMLQLLNAHQRDASEWEDLFQRADPRFRFESINRPVGSAQSIIVASWTG